MPLEWARLIRCGGATRGSAGVDLATAADVTLADDKVQIVPSVVNGPLGYGLSALLIGRSSMSKQGLFVLPGLIDVDYTGNIGIMVRALFPPVNIAAGTRIAQLIPFQSSVPKTKLTERGSHGFGSTDSPQVAFAMTVTQRKPSRMVPGQNSTTGTLFLFRHAHY
uniref:dUTPase-like domain-containing protein n=1 Tax=Gopherus agassizii TaxID=38772 RepID=A0A452GNT8_9SAUR